MSIERINRQTYINPYGNNCNKPLDKLDKSKEIDRIDRIEISEIGKSIKDRLLSDDKVNLEKIADITNRIDSGTYKVDAGLTAQSILNAMKESNS